jgi:hypothetical protein
MKIVQRAIASINRANLTFGLREAVIMSLVGIAIACAVAFHYAR